MRRVIAAVAVAFLSACSGIALTPHPSPTNPVTMCHVSCAFGWQQILTHTCRGGSQFTEDIRVNGEENFDDEHAADRWLTGSTSIIADAEVTRRLAAGGVKPLDPEWPARYAEFMRGVRKELGGDAFASYLKSEVVLGSCDTYRAHRCSELSSANPCSAHPGEPDPMGARH